MPLSSICRAEAEAREVQWQEHMASMSSRLTARQEALNNATQEAAELQGQVVRLRDDLAALKSQAAQPLSNPANNGQDASHHDDGTGPAGKAWDRAGPGYFCDGGHVGVFGRAAFKAGAGDRSGLTGTPPPTHRPTICFGPACRTAAAS